MPADNTNPDSALVAAVHDMLMSGNARWQIKACLDDYAKEADQDPPSADEIDAAIAACVENWIADADQGDGEVHAYHLALRKHLISRSITVNDYPTAGRIAQDLAKLQDQYRQKRDAAKKKPARSRRIAKLRNARPGSVRLVASND